MDFVVSLIAAVAVVVAGLALLCIIMNDAHSCATVDMLEPEPVPAALVSCARDGVAITSQDRLHIAVTMLDRMINTGRAPDGKPSTMNQTTATADAFARQQASPDVTLAQLAHCDGTLVSVYPHGYWMLSSALVRESARRRAAAQPILTPRAP